MGKIIKDAKTADVAEDAALTVLAPALSRAFRLANVQEPEFDVTWTSRRVETPFAAVFSLRFQKTTQLVAGTVNIPGVSYMQPTQAENVVDILRRHLIDTHSAPSALRARVASGDLSDQVLHDAATAATSRHCESCAGHGTFHCSPCGGRGECACGTCSNSGYVRCSTCGGRGRTDGSSGPSIICYSCSGNGSVHCYSCGGTTRVTCSGCGGRGEIGCNPCGRTGVITTIYGGKLSCSCAVTMGETELTRKQAGLLNVWARAGMRGHKREDDLVTPWSDIDNAPVTKADGAQDYRVDFKCHATVTHLDFTYRDKPAWAEYLHLPPLASAEFSSFLDGDMGRADASLDGATSPSGIVKALRKAGFEDVARLLEKGTEDFLENVRHLSSGAITGSTLSGLIAAYASASNRYARTAMWSAWKLPVTLTLGGWAAASHFGLTGMMAEHETIYPMSALALGAGLVALVSSSFEARRAIRAETGSVRGWKIGPAAIVTTIGATALYWTSSFYGFTV
jgi:hypothetical protein